MADTDRAPSAQETGQDTRVLLGIFSESFFSQLSAGIVAFALPLYARKLGFSIAEIGILMSLHLSVSLILKPVSGWVADRLGYRRSASAAIALRSLLNILFVVSSMPWHLVGVQAARGLSKSVRKPAMHALIAVHGGKKQLASTFAWYHTARGVAGPMGRALAGVLLTASAMNFRWVFGLAAALSVLPLVTLYVTSRSGHGRRETSRSSRPSSSPSRASSAVRQGWITLLPFIGLGGLVSASAHMLHGLMPLLLVEYAGLNEAQAGLLYLVSSAVMIGATPVFGWLCDHDHRKLVLMMRSLANVASSVLYLMVPTFMGAACAKACDKFGTAAFRPAWATMMAEAAAGEPAKRAHRLALMSTGDDVGNIAGPLLGGLLWHTWGVAALMGVRIVFALIAEGYMLVLTRSITRSGLRQGSLEFQLRPNQGDVERSERV